jgi:hypothetical protein
MTLGRRAAVLALGAWLLASGASAAEAYGLRAAKAALSGRSQAVIVAVPDRFIHVGDKLQGDAATAGDWQFFFNDWVERRGSRSNVVVVTPAQLKSLVRRPISSGECVTLWVRDRSHGLIYDASCAPTVAVYEAGDRWLSSGAAPQGFREAELRIR